jgi:hypothetical protein
MPRTFDEKLMLEYAPLFLVWHMLLRSLRRTRRRILRVYGMEYLICLECVKCECVIYIHEIAFEEGDTL